MKPLQTWRNPDPRCKPRLRFDFVAAIIVTVLIVIFSCSQPIVTHGTSVDLAKVWTATPQPDAARWDAIIISITREGKIYCRSDQFPAERIPDCIRSSVAKGSRPWVFIKADARSRYGVTAKVIEVLSQMRTRRVVFLVEQRRR